MTAGRSEQHKRTVYESDARRRRGRRRVRVLVVALLAAAVAVGVTTLVILSAGGAGTDGGRELTVLETPAAPAPADPLRLGRLAAVDVRQGEKATFRYRIVEAPGPVAVTLVVKDTAGIPVKRRRLSEAAEPETRLEAVVPIGLEPGLYRYELRLGADAEAGSPGPVAIGAAGGAVGSAELRVLEPLPPGFPGANAVAAAEEWARDREGEVAFAVVDTNGEPAGGYRAHEPFQLASLSKAILLVASLRSDPTPDAATAATLTRMITESDNGAAYTIFARVGARGMRAVARAAHLEDYEQGAGWLDTQDSAADQASFYHQLESLVPAGGRSLARRLLADVIPIQRWGIPAAAGPEGWRSYHKSGWLGMGNKLMVQAAWLEKGKKRWALAVLTDENPTRSYGWDTEKGITGLLLGREPSSAYLAVVLE